MTKNKNTLKKKTLLFDFLLVCVIAILSITAFLIIRLSADDGAVAVVTVDGKRHSSYPLYEDKEVIIENGSGGTNILVISDGKVYIRSASCPDGICAAHKPIGHTDESIICLPNGVVITVEGENSTGAADVVS